MALASRWAWRKALHRLFSLEGEDCRLFFYLQKYPIGDVLRHWHQRESTLANERKVGEFWHCLEVGEDWSVCVLVHEFYTDCPRVARVIWIWSWLSGDFSESDDALFFSGVVNEESIARLHGAHMPQRQGIVDAIPERFTFTSEVINRIVMIWFSFSKEVVHICSVADLPAQLVDNN